MKPIRVKDLGLWIVADYSDGEDQLPSIQAFYTREEAREYAKGNKPTLLSKIRLFFERGNSND